MFIFLPYSLKQASLPVEKYSIISISSSIAIFIFFKMRWEWNLQYTKIPLKQISIIVRTATEKYAFAEEKQTTSTP
jgi:hypothetical protein